MKDIIESFVQFGWPGFFALLVIGILYFGIYYMQKKSEEKTSEGFAGLADALNRQNTQLINAMTANSSETQKKLIDLISEAFSVSLQHRDIFKENKHSVSMSYRIKVSEEIYDMLKDLFNRCHAQRAVVIEFHNSKENLTGLSFMWYDVQYEVNDKGIAPISGKCINLQASNLIPIVNMIYNSNNGIVLLDDNAIEGIYEKSTVLYNHLKEVNAGHVCYVGLHSKDNNLIGIIALEYNKNKFFHEEMVDEQLISEIAAKIALLLSFEESEVKDEVNKHHS